MNASCASWRCALEREWVCLVLWLLWLLSLQLCNEFCPLRVPVEECFGLPYQCGRYSYRFEYLRDNDWDTLLFKALNFRFSFVYLWFLGGIFDGRQTLLQMSEVRVAWMHRSAHLIPNELDKGVCFLGCH